MTELLKQKDIKIAQNLYSKISKNKETFLELLNNILELTTLVPVCIAEYGCDAFGSFNIKTLILDEINIVLREYGMLIERQ